MSESNKQQQDLDTVRDDLGSLKFGFAILQNSIRSESYKQKEQLRDIQETLESRTNELDMSIERLRSEKHPCRGMGWKKVVDLDMANLTHNCPSGWMETSFSKRTCGRTGGTGTDQCFSTTLRIGQEYSQVCGRIKAYQFGATEGFFNSIKSVPITSIDEAYFDGVVLLYKTPSSGSEHIWTFAVGRSEHPDSEESFTRRCPCDTSSTINVPAFVGANYFCESQNAVFPDFPSLDGVIFYPEDVLWDGEDCLDTSNCCEINRPPYFIRNLGEKTYSDIEAKICLRRNNGRVDVAVEVIELYVQ